MPEATEQAEAFLQEPLVGVLATVDRRGRPHAMPIWYMYEDGVILMSAGRGSQKHRNIERNPAASLVVDRRETPYYAVMVRGNAEIGPPLDIEHHERLSKRYLGDEEGKRYAERTVGHDAITIRLHPEDWFEFHGQAGRDD
ncbi:MAG: PPOX class F420-dependent oxidoreductase [Thermomicrobiales bacterium]